MSGEKLFYLVCGCGRTVDNLTDEEQEAREFEMCQCGSAMIKGNGSEILKGEIR